MCFFSSQVSTLFDASNFGSLIDVFTFLSTKELGTGKLDSEICGIDAKLQL